MPTLTLPPQKIGAQMLERGGRAYTTAIGDTVYVLGQSTISAHLICFVTGGFRLQVCFDGGAKQAKTPALAAKLWSWWLAQYESAHQSERERAAQ